MLHFRVKLSFALTALVAGSLGAQALPNPMPLKYVGPPTIPGITAGDLMTRLYKYADDSMMGRRVGTEYNVKATNYIESEARRMGLLPAGDNGGYIQELGMITRVIDRASTLTIGGKVFYAGVDFLANSGGKPVQIAGGQVTFGGTSLDTTNLLTPEQVTGRYLLMRPSAPIKDVQALVQSAGYKAYVPSLRGSAGTITIVGDVIPPNTLNNAFHPSARLTPTQPERDTPVSLAITTKVAEAILGVAMADARKGMAGANTVTTDVRFIDSPSHMGRNVVAILPGSDPKLKGQYVAIGAHNDHVGFGTASQGESDSLKVWGDVAHPAGAEGGRTTPITAEEWTKINADIAAMRKTYPPRADSIFNGADDDGSGSVSVLEIAEAFAKGSVKPKRSIIFVWHTGEESGMWGSAFFMDHPTVPRDSIVAQLNIDMVGRGAATDVTGQAKGPQDANGRFTGPGAELHGGDRYVQLVGSRRLSTELGDLVEKVNIDKKHGFMFDYNIDADGHQQNIYCRSDHWSYGKWGVPVVFFTTGGHADYHQVTDEPQFIRYDHMASLDKLIFDIAVATANLDHRVVVDKPKPNPAPAVNCKQ